MIIIISDAKRDLLIKLIPIIRYFWEVNCLINFPESMEFQTFLKNNNKKKKKKKKCRGTGYESKNNRKSINPRFQISFFLSNMILFSKYSTGINSFTSIWLN